jgi:Mg2+ and Co2+ transporter CorA
VWEQQASLKVMGEKAMDDVRSRQLLHSSHSGSLEDRVMSLEARLSSLGKASATITELQAKEAQEALRHNKALADATDAIAQVVSRVKQVEERVAPDIMR